MSLGLIIFLISVYILSVAIFYYVYVRWLSDYFDDGVDNDAFVIFLSLFWPITCLAYLLGAVVVGVGTFLGFITKPIKKLALQHKKKG